MIFAILFLDVTAVLVTDINIIITMNINKINLGLVRRKKEKRYMLLSEAPGLGAP